MSLQALTWVLEHSEATRGGRCLMFAIANYADARGGGCYASTATLAKEARISRRGTQKALDKLVEDGHIEATGTSSYGTTIYAIVGMQQGGELSSPGGGELTDAKVRGSSPKPTKDRQASENAREEQATLGAVDVGPELLADAEALLAERRRVGGRVVTAAEMGKAAAALDAYNRCAGSDFGLGGQLTRIVMRVRDRPSWDAAAFVRLVESAWRIRWWEQVETSKRRRPNPGVIFGEGAFENVVQDAADEKRGTLEKNGERRKRYTSPRHRNGEGGG